MQTQVIQWTMTAVEVLIGIAILLVIIRGVQLFLAIKSAREKAELLNEKASAVQAKADAIQNKIEAIQSSYKNSLFYRLKNNDQLKNATEIYANRKKNKVKRQTKQLTKQNKKLKKQVKKQNKQLKKVGK